MPVVDPLNDDLLDHDMRRRILEVTERMGARPADLPALGQAHEDAVPFCWTAPRGGWHLTVRERDRVLSDRHTTDPDEFVFWVAESVSERIALRLHPPEKPGFRAASWRAQYQLLRGIEPAWADAWLTATRSALTAAGADRAVLDLLPTPP
ncbi:Imm63 family immunity protein [Rhodococcus sp. NPDC057529]|uniref:Imm63 family immunity protein n=1 Tax=Rhodococcus sp. NPDC057529 TaxID=3346158 RepID=UPI003670041E